MLPDVQRMSPEAKFKLTRVGVRGIKKPLVIQRPQKSVNLIGTIDAFVDLPAERKGSDMSRSVEIVSEIVDLSARKKYRGIEYLAEDIVDKLLKKHDYANYAEVRICTDYFLERIRPSGKKSIEKYSLFAVASKRRGEKGRKMIGVEVIAMMVCPCAMENTRSIYYENFPKNLPVISHNQRGVITIMVDVIEGHEVDADDLIEIAEESASSPTYEILKRQEEVEVVWKAHNNPKFVEDVVRDILKKLLEKYPNMPDECRVVVRCESEESIHKHNAFAERITTFGELRK